MESTNTPTPSSRGSLTFPMENPFTVKVGQVFTGFGIGCGFGIGVGRPIYLVCIWVVIYCFLCLCCGWVISVLGAIPALQQVMSATRGATDAFSGVGRHVNGSLKKLGLKNIEAGVGCGVGIGHGFGVGLAVKPGVVQRIQSSVVQAVAKMMMNLGIVPGLSSVQSIIPGSVQNSMNVLGGTSGNNLQSLTGDVMQLASKTTGSMFQHPSSDESSHQELTHTSYESKSTLSEISVGSRSEKVISNFLQSPVLENEEEMEVNELAGKLRSENNVLQVLLKHQQAIEKIMEENEKLHQVLVEELKVPASKLQSTSERRTKFNYPCSDCFECRRRLRKSAR